MGKSDNQGLGLQADLQGKCPESRMLSAAWKLSSLVGCTNSLPQAAPPLGSLSTLQDAGVWLGADRFWSRHPGEDRDSDPEFVGDVTEDTLLPGCGGCPQVCLTLHLGLSVLPGIEVEQLLAGALPFLLLKNAQAGRFRPREHRPAATAGDLHPTLLVRDSLLLLGLSLLLRGKRC